MPRRPAPATPARPSRKAALDAPDTIERLSRLYPGATTELHHRNAFELLVATILSAQSTDARVNLVTPTLFARFPDAAALARAPLPEVETLVQATGFFRMKARAIVTMARRLIDEHEGQVPVSMDALVELPGVGRKTANVVLGHTLGVPGLPVDRHVLRVAGRIGLAKGTTPERVEQELCNQLPPAKWTLASDCLILHGRRVCRPKPLCSACPLTDRCRFFLQSGGATGTGVPARRRTVLASPATAAPPPKRRGTRS